MNGTPSPLDRHNVTFIETIEFVGELNEKLYKRNYSNLNPNAVHMGLVFLKSMDKMSLIDHFIERTYDFWDQVVKQEERYFIKYAKDIFQELDGLGIGDIFVNCFTSKDSAGNPIVDKEDRDLLWVYFGALIKISINHINQTRKSNPSYHSKVNLETSASMWKMKI
ncbi:hypothetical protein D3C87_974920 [compost metagenome]